MHAGLRTAVQITDKPFDPMMGKALLVDRTVVKSVIAQQRADIDRTAGRSNERGKHRVEWASTLQSADIIVIHALGGDAVKSLRAVAAAAP